MATKDMILKKKLVRDGIVCVILLLVLGAGGFFLSNYDDDSLTEKQNREQESTQLKSEHDNIKQQLGTGFEVSAYYNAYVRNHSAVLLQDREAASQLINTLREQNHLASLTVTISPVIDAAIEAIHLKSGALTKSDVHLSFSAVSDNSIFGFIEALERNLPGIIAIKELKFIRTGDLSSAVVVGMSQHRITPLVTGELSFTWLGIRPADPSKPPAGGMQGAR